MIVYTHVETEEEVRLGYELSRYEHSPLWERSEGTASPSATTNDPEDVPPNALKAITVAQLDELIDSLGLDIEPTLKKPAKVAAILEALLDEDAGDAPGGDADPDVGGDTADDED